MYVIASVNTETDFAYFSYVLLCVFRAQSFNKFPEN